MSNEELTKLLEEAKSSDSDTRFEAVAELTHYHSPEVDELLVEAAEDPDPDVASRGLEGLSERGHAKARELILKYLSSGNSQLRFAALRFAGVVDIAPCLDSAWEALNRRRWVERMAGAGALARAGITSALPKIRSLALRARAVKDYAPAAHLLGSAALLGDRESGDLFLARLSGGSHTARIAALSFLQRRGRLHSMAEIVGKSRLRDAITAGKQAQEHSSKPRYTRRFDEVLRRLDQA